MSLEVFDIPKTLLDKVNAILESKEENPERSAFQEEETEHDKKKVAVSPRHADDDSKVILEKNKKKKKEDLKEVSAPGKEAWIKANKARFEKEYGPEKGKEVLYAKAWKMHNEELEEAKKAEKIIFNPEVNPDRINEPDKNQKTV